MRKLFSSEKAKRYQQKKNDRSKKNAGVRYTSKESNVDNDNDVNNDGNLSYDNDVSNDGNVSKNNHRSTRMTSQKKVLYVSLVILGVVLATVALTVILKDVSEDAAARSEYGQIRDRFPDISGQANDDDAGNENNENSEGFDEDADLAANEEDARALRELSLDELAAINGDFIGWINAINSIDYPVVRGRDNERYINTTFFGSRNSAGTIFMDYRHARGFDEQVVLLYGHRTRDGSMFTALERYLDSDFMRRNPNINIIKRDGTRLTYTVFAAKVTDAWDPAYTAGVHEAASASEVFPGVPQNASHFLLLSTCTRGNNDDERLLVFAALT